MQQLKKNFVLLLGIFLFSACSGLPIKPKVEICANDVPNKQVECYDNQTQEYRSIPIESTDRYIMYSPEDWALVLLYIERLKRKLRGSRIYNKSMNRRISVKTRISLELEKIIKTTRLHNPKNEESGNVVY